MENESRPPTESPFASLGNALLMRRGLVLVIILVVALIGFEMFNYSTTDYALTDLLGDMRFAGVRWSTILALAFCGIDFAGIARLFTPGEEQESGGKEVWYLFAAWLLAATLNAFLTWWGVAMALANRSMESTAIVDQGLLSRGVPIFVACVVWVTRILLISNLTSSTARLFQQASEKKPARYSRASAEYQQERPAPRRTPAPPPTTRPAAVTREQTVSRPASAASRPQTAVRPRPEARPEPRPVIPGQTPSTRTDASRPRPAVRPVPAPKPVEPEPEAPEEILPPEPEYIPDPGYAPYRPGYHSLSARGNNNGSEESRRS